MKAITLYPEWAWAICRLGKQVENRTWRPPANLLGERIAIHAGKSIGGKTSKKGILSALQLMSYEAVLAGWETEYLAGSPYRFTRASRFAICNSDEIPTSAIVATAVLTQCTKDFYGWFNGEIDSGSEEWASGTPEVHRLGWQAPDQFHWLLEDVRVFAEPVSATGKMGFWEVPFGKTMW